MPEEKRALDKNKKKIEAKTMAILTLTHLFANGHLRTADEVVRVSANAVGQWKILSVRLFTWTTNDFLVVNAVVLVFDSHLA